MNRYLIPCLHHSTLVLQTVVGFVGEGKDKFSVLGGELRGVIPLIGQESAKA